MAKLFANNGEPDQTVPYVASDLGLHCLPVTLLRVSRLQWVKVMLEGHTLQLQSQEEYSVKWDSNPSPRIQ